METNDITAEKVEKLYEYLKEKNNQKIKNIDYNIAERESFLLELQDEIRINEVKEEIEGLKEYKTQFEEKLSSIEELKMFSDELKELDEEISAKNKEIDQIEKEEIDIDLSEEDSPSNLYDLSERKKELNKNLESLNWQRKGKIGIILSSYEQDLDKMPENLKYYSTISNLELSLENANDIKDISSKKMNVLKERMEEKGIKLGENNLYDLASLKGNDRKLAERYNDLVNQISDFEYDISYYKYQIETLNELSEMEQEIEELSKKDSIDDFLMSESLKIEAKKLIQKVKETQIKYNNREKIQEEKITKEEIQEEQKNEEQKNEELKDEKLKYEKNKPEINYHSSSDKLINNYNERMNALYQSKDNIQEKINDILEEFNLNEINIEDEQQYEENELLLELKEEYDRLNDDLTSIENDIENIEKSDILNKVEDLKNIENMVEELDNDIENIENEIDSYKEILENEELSEDSEEKNKARVNLEKLQKEKAQKISSKNEAIDKKDTLYKDINRIINNKSKEKNKKISQKTNNSQESQGYWVFPQNNTTEQQSNVINEQKENEEEIKSLAVTTGNIIEDYSKADNKIKNSLYLSGEFANLLKDLKSARGLGKITKEQKSLLKDAIENHGNSISKELEDLSPEVFTKIVKDIYGDDTEKLNKYLTKKVMDDEEIINHGIFADLYNIDKGVIKNLNSIEKMNPKSVELINDLFNKYYEKIQNGEIEENGSLDLQFKKVILNPVKFGIISSYNKDIQKPFLFRLNKIKMLFSKKARQENEKTDIITSNINKNESKETRKISKADKLGLGDSVEKNPPAIDKKQEKEVVSKDIESR